MVTQSVSHDCVQHEGSTAHTALQHATSSHAPCACGLKQLDAVTPHVPGVPWQRNPAYCAQVTSHWVSQQKGSEPHTLAQQFALSQAGFEWAAKQLPLTEAPQ